MVHDCVVVELPLVAVAVKILDGLRDEDAIVCEFVVPAMGTPFRAQAIVQPPPPVETVKAVVAEARFGTRTVAAEGTAPEITQVELTDTVHVQDTLS